MNNKRFVSMISFLLMVLNPLILIAEDEADDTPALQNTVELGIIATSDDAYRFGRYNGLEEEAVYFLGDINARRFTEDGQFWSARGTNLGLDSRYLRLEAGKQGKHSYFLEYDQLPNYESDTASTAFRGVESDLLTLPPGFAIGSNLNSSLLPFDIETTRKRIGLGASLNPRRHWKLDVAFNHETKDGLDRLGGAINSSSGVPGTGLVANTTSTLLPEPVDYNTRQVDVTLHYAKDKRQFDIAYHASLFENGENSLAWENPFIFPVDGVADGSQSLAPDNEFHQLSLTGSYQLPLRSQITGFLSRGRMTQDQSFQSYTVIDGPGAALPRSSFDGEVWMTTAQLGLSSRPFSKLRLNARYRYDERDNDSPIDSYDTITLDAFNPAGTVENRPLGYHRNQANLTANYRINKAMSLRGGYRYNAMSRDYENVEREDTDEHTLFAKWKVKLHTKVNLSVNAETSKRDGSNYQSPIDENPALRKYHLADRDRTKVGASMNIMPTDQLDITASADYIQDDYDNSTIGLTESTLPTWTLDIAWQPSNKITTSVWYTREDIESQQAGSQAGLVIPDWTADFTDTVDSAGISAQMKGIHKKWDIGTDLVYTGTKGEVDLVNLAGGGAVTPYPDLKSSMTSLKLWTKYHYRKDISWKLGYRYERYSADNWALDDLQAESVANALLLGEETPDYDVHVVAASVLFHF